MHLSTHDFLKHCVALHNDSTNLRPSTAHTTWLAAASLITHKDASTHMASIPISEPLPNPWLKHGLQHTCAPPHDLDLVGVALRPGLVPVTRPHGMHRHLVTGTHETEKNMRQQLGILIDVALFPVQGQG
jgi:hypothetical protein